LDVRYEQYQSVEILRSRLESWLLRLDAVSVGGIDHISELKKRTRTELEAAPAFNAVKAGMRSVQVAVERRREGVLAEQPIDPERLLEIARYASAIGFDTVKGNFPMQFFFVSRSVEAQQDFVLTMKQVRKGELTRVEMDQRASNESDYYSETLARQVAVIVLSDVLRHCAIKEILVSDAEAYWQALKVEAARITTNGGQPILMLDSATRPEWVWDWQHADFEADHNRPQDLRVRRHEGRGTGYICDFNDIRVYVAPIPMGQSLLLSSATFRRVTFTNYGDDCYVRVEVNEVEGAKSLLVDLKLVFSRLVEVGPTDAVRLVYAHN
jgi:hypothetical protein